MTTEHDTDDLDDFAMLTPPTRPSPCKAATAPEVDPVEARLEREVQAAPHITGVLGYREGDIDHNRRVFVDRMVSRGLSQELSTMMADMGQQMGERAVEVRHGSGKVKV